MIVCVSTSQICWLRILEIMNFSTRYGSRDVRIQVPFGQFLDDSKLLLDDTRAHRLANDCLFLYDNLLLVVAAVKVADTVELVETFEGLDALIVVKGDGRDIFSCCR